MNKCGDCKVCCTVLSIKNFKDAGKPCDKIYKNGCSIYKTRPEACAHFKCLWLTSDWLESFRPDKSGIMIASFQSQISVYRIKENINMDLFHLVYENSGKQQKKVIGYDCRNLSA